MRFCLKLLACLLLWVGFVAPLTAGAAQVEIAVERPSSNGTAEPVFIAQTNATPGPVVTALPVEEDFDDPDDVTFTCVFTPSTGVPDATLSQVGKPPENAVLL